MSDDDAALFFMLIDTTSSDKHKINIEKIHKNVFQRAKISKITISDEDMETLEIMLDPQIRKQVKSSLDNMKEKDLGSWNRIKIQSNFEIKLHKNVEKTLKKIKKQKWA